MKRDVKWVLIISLIMFLWSAWLTLIIAGGYYFIPDHWYYLRNINVLAFIITIGLATLYTADFWKPEPMFEVTIVMFIASMILFFVSNLQWIAIALFGTPLY